MPPVEQIQLNVSKMFAFVELYSCTGILIFASIISYFRCLDADIALAFDGFALGGQSLRIRRPRDYCCPPGHVPRTWNVNGVVGTQVEDGPYKIFMGGSLFFVLQI
jgi:hypothetical protein